MAHPTPLADREERFALSEVVCGALGLLGSTRGRLEWALRYAVVGLSVALLVERLRG